MYFKRLNHPNWINSLIIPPEALNTLKDNCRIHVDKGNANNLRLKFNTVTSFLDTEKELWIGTDGGGISIWDKEKDTYQFLNANVRDPSSLVRDEVLWSPWNFDRTTHQKSEEDTLP